MTSPLAFFIHILHFCGLGGESLLTWIPFIQTELQDKVTMAATTAQGRLQGKNAIITGAGGYVYDFNPEKHTTLSQALTDFGLG